MYAVVDQPGSRPTRRSAAQSGSHPSHLRPVAVSSKADARPLALVGGGSVGGVLVDPAEFLADREAPVVTSAGTATGSPQRQRHLRLVAESAKAPSVEPSVQPGVESGVHPVLSARAAAPLAASSDDAGADLRSALRTSGAAARRSRVVARRRLVLASVVLGVSVIGVGMAGASGSRPSESEVASSRSYLVQPGDSLWSIARSLQPQGDVRLLVHQLEQANQVVNLQAGSTLLLP